MPGDGAAKAVTSLGLLSPVTQCSNLSPPQPLTPTSQGAAASELADGSGTELHVGRGGRSAALGLAGGGEYGGAGHIIHPGQGYVTP